MRGPTRRSAKPRNTLSTPRTMNAMPISSASVFRLTSGSARISPPSTRSTTAASSRSPRFCGVGERAHEVDDAGDDEPDAEHDQDREQALAGPPHDDEAGHDPEQPEHGGEHARRGVAVVAERVDEAEGAEQQQVDAGDQREREQRDVRVDEREDAGDRAEHARRRSARVPNCRRSPRTSGSTGVVVVMRATLRPRGVSEGHTARVISTEPPGCEHGQPHVRRELGRVLLELARRVAAGPVADAPVGAPVDRHRERGCSSASASRRLARVHVARAGLRAPARDRHERGVERAREPRHLRVGLGVAREVDAADDEADAARRGARTGSAGRRGRPAPPRTAPRRARSRRRRPACAPCGRCGAACASAAGGATTGGVRVEPAQRRRVEVVVVGVREEDRVEAPEVARARPPRGAGARRAGAAAGR